MRGEIPVSKLKKKIISAVSVVLVLSSLFVMVAQAYTIELNNGTDKITYNYPDNTMEESRKSLKTFFPEFENLGNGKTIDQPLTVANQSATPLECKLRLSFSEEIENTTAPEKLLVLWQKAKDFYQISITDKEGAVLYDSTKDQQEEATWRNMNLGILPAGATQTFELHVAVNGSDAAYDDSKNKLELSLITKQADPAAVTPSPTATASVPTATTTPEATAQASSTPTASVPAATTAPPVLSTATPAATHKSSLVKVTATPKVTTNPKSKATPTATAKAKAATGKTTPKTGDETPIAGISILAAAALGVFIFLSIKNKKNKN